MIDIAFTVGAFIFAANFVGFLFGFYAGRKRGELDALRWQRQYVAPRHWGPKEHPDSYYRGMLLEADTQMRADAARRRA